MRSPTPPAQRPASVRHRLTTGLAYTPSAFVALAGIWLLMSAVTADGSSGYPRWHDAAAGALITVLAAIRVVHPQRTAVLSVINAALGGCLVAAPIAFGFTDSLGSAWNDMIVGFLVVLLAGVSAAAGDQQPPTAIGSRRPSR